MVELEDEAEHGVTQPVAGHVGAGEDVAALEQVPLVGKVEAR